MSGNSKTELTTCSTRIFSEVILKIASRCNLACTYCYMYELEDKDGWKAQPRFMQDEVLVAAAEETARHAREHALPRVRVVFHGGEPLLAGTERIMAVTDLFRDFMPYGTELRFSMQTNGVLLTQEILRALAPEGIRFGVSLDNESNGKRLTRQGIHSTAGVLRALELLRQPEFRQAYGGILSVIDVDTDPVRTYEFLRSQEPALLDFLLPLATHESPPSPGAVTGRWLGQVFDAWYLDRGAPDIRLFRILMSRLLGRDVRSGFIGFPPEHGSVVIQADGSAELLDALRSVTGAPVQTGMNITTHTLDEIGQHPGFTPPPPAAACRECPVFSACGGGYYPHRWSSARGYDNPSAYCADLTYLIRHISGRMDEQGVA